MAKDGDANAQLYVIGWVLGSEMPAAKFVNSDLVMQQVFWLDVAKE
jgi:hypothetical protein